MHKAMRIIAILLLGVMAAAYATSADAKKGRARVELSKKVKEANETREKEKRALQQFEQEAQEFAMYQACAVKTKAIEDAYRTSAAAKASDISSTDEYLFRAYLRTVKWDGECFEWKDPAAAKRASRSLKEYVIGGVHPALREQLRKLFIELETLECSPGLKCQPGITSAFRDDYRQKIATGYKARTGYSMHGGSKVTKGWGDGQAVDVVNVSDPEIFGDPRQSASDVMWHHIDSIGSKVSIYRPMPKKDPMHLQSMGWLRSLIASGKRTIEKVVEKTKEKTEEVIKKFKKKK